MFAVWEPILPIDWSPPTTSALGRLSDRRVVQLWDSEHVLAKIMAESRDQESRPDCCVRKGVLWDLIAVYPARAMWGQSLPTATLFNGPVVRAVVSHAVF